MSRQHSSRESLDFPHEHPDPSSSATPPSSPSDINSHPRHPSRRSRSQHSRRTRTATGDDDHESHHHHSTSSSRFLARLMAREDRDSKKMSNLLVIANERLEGETVRANQAERNASELVRRCKEVMQGRDVALRDAARVNEELRLYKVQLETAQREIFRAQEIINQVAKEKNDAEEEAARARTKARQLQEEKIVMLAREEGRREGFKEGLSRGRRIGFEEGRSIVYEDGPRRIEYVGDGYEPEVESIDVRRRVRSPENRTPIVAPQPMRAPSRARSRSNTYDTARHAPTLPVPTLVTPVSIPSVTRAPTRTPVPLQIPASVPVPAPSRSPESIRPIPVRNSMPSPAPHSVRILRDGFIPQADRNSSYIDVPPPHELSSPVPTASPQGSEEALPHPGPREDVFGPTVLSRDYAYSRGAEPPILAPRPRTTSAASGGSTRLSAYDLISPPRGPRADSAGRPGAYSPRSVSNVLDDFDRDRGSRTPQMNTRERERRRNEEEVSPTQRIVDDWRSANRDVSPVRANNRAQSPNHLRSPRVSGGPRPLQPRPEATAQAPQDVNPTRSPLQWLFGRRNRGQSNSNSSQSVPEILIEPPSVSPSNTSPATTAQHPYLLSPEDANRDLPLPGDDELNEFLDAHGHQLPPSSYNNNSAPFPHSDNPLPIGFVPLSGPTVMMAPGAARMQSPKVSGNYVAAPLPAGLTYPEPLSRSLTSFELVKPRANKTTSPTNSSSLRRRVLSLGSSSPAPLQRPISLFSDDA